MSKLMTVLACLGFALSAASTPAQEAVSKKKKTTPVKTQAPTPAPTAEATAAATAEATAVATVEATAQATPSPAKTEVAPEEAKSKKPAEVSHKSPGLAGGLAVFPGVIVHGTGHMYAGAWMKGLGLLAIEGAAAAIAYNQVAGGWSDMEKLFKSSNQIPVDLSPALSRLGVALVATSAFLWTWFDDMAGAPIAASVYNRKADDSARAQLRLMPRGAATVLALETKF